MTGRWPANVILSPGMAEALDQQSGEMKSRRGTRSGSFTGGVYGEGTEGWQTMGGYDDEGGASRFFLTAGYEPWELEWIYKAGLRPCGTESPDAR